MTKLSEETKIDLKINNAWAILVSVVLFVVSMMWVYFGIIQKMDLMVRDISYIREDINEISGNFKDIHKDVVQNHDDIIILKQLSGMFR